MLITFGIGQNQEPKQNLLKGGKGIFFLIITYKDIFLAVGFSSQNVFRVVSDKIGHKLQILSET